MLRKSTPCAKYVFNICFPYIIQTSIKPEQTFLKDKNRKNIHKIPKS